MEKEVKKEAKREYLRCVNTTMFVEIVAKLMKIEVDEMKMVSRPIVSPNGAAVSFTIVGEDDKCEYMVLAKPFECRIFTVSEYDFDVTYKKPFGEIMCEVVYEARKYGKTKLTKDQYMQDYNDYHNQKFEKQKAKAEQEHAQQLL